MASEIELTYVTSTVIMCLADALRDLGESGRAKVLYLDGLRLAIEQHERRNAAIAISGLAALAAAAGNSKQAARLCGSADALLDQVGAAMTPGGQECYGRASELARTALGDAAFERAWNDGSGTIAGMRYSSMLRANDQLIETGSLAASWTCSALLVDGKSNQQIAAELYISPRTVTNHVASILSKLGLHSRSAAVSYALRNQLI